MNTNDDENEEKLYGILTNFIRKLTDFFFVIIGEKSSSNIPLNNMYYVIKSAKLTYIYVHMYLQLYDSPNVLIKNMIFLRQKLTKT